MSSADRIENAAEWDDTKLAQQVGETVLRAVARDIVLRGEVDGSAVSPEDLRNRARHELLEYVGEGHEFEIVRDQTETILLEARRYAEDDKIDLAFVFYGLFVEHLLNRAIRDRAQQLELSEGETIELLKKSVYDKTGLTWRLLFGANMPERIVADIREIAKKRNAFAHFKWTAEPMALMSHAQITREAEKAVRLAERCAETLHAYIDTLIVAAGSPASAWLAGSDSASERK